MSDHSLFHAIHQLSRQLTKSINEALEPFGLHSAQWSVLFVLKNKGSLTQAELCDYLAVEAPPMTRTIQRLVKQNLVELKPCDDKRKKYVYLTEKAIHDFPFWEESILQRNDALISSLPEKSQKQLQTILSDWLFHLRK